MSEADRVGKRCTSSTRVPTIQRPRTRAHEGRAYHPTGIVQTLKAGASSEQKRGWPRWRRQALVAQSASVRRGRILIIDDEPAIGRVVSRVLQSEHDVLAVTDAREALTRVAAGEVFDVVFCDLMMPGMTGMDLFGLLRKTNPELARRVVFVTGGTFTQCTPEFLNPTSNATSSKPFDAVPLKRIVADYIGARGAT